MDDLKKFFVIDDDDDEILEEEDQPDNEPVKTRNKNKSKNSGNSNDKKSPKSPTPPSSGATPSSPSTKPKEEPDIAPVSSSSQPTKEPLRIREVFNEWLTEQTEKQQNQTESLSPFVSSFSNSFKKNSIVIVISPPYESDIMKAEIMDIMLHGEDTNFSDLSIQFSIKILSSGGSAASSTHNSQFLANPPNLNNEENDTISSDIITTEQNLDQEDNVIHGSFLITDDFPFSKEYTFLIDEQTKTFRMPKSSPRTEKPDEKMAAKQVFDTFLQKIQENLQNIYFALTPTQEYAIYKTAQDDLLESVSKKSNSKLDTLKEKLFEREKANLNKKWKKSQNENNSVFLFFEDNQQFLNDEEENAKIYFSLSPGAGILNSKLNNNKFVMKAWGIDPKKFITVQISFQTHTAKFEDFPRLEIFQSGDTFNLNSNLSEILSNRTKFGIGWTLKQRCLDFWKKYWPFYRYEENYLKSEKFIFDDFLEFLANSIALCNASCLVCGKTLEHSGLRPTVCNSPLCLFSHENFGLGVDLEHFVITYSDIVDLFLTMLYAAASGGGGNISLNPFPNIEISGGKASEKVYKFSDGSAICDLVGKIPPVSTLQNWAKENKLREKLEETTGSPLAAPLIRWLICTNRCFIKKLKPKENSLLKTTKKYGIHNFFPEMKTPHQYMMVNQSPEREKQFLDLKKKHGSLYAWHGSNLKNWHAIFRTGLKVMSGTAGQVNGAAYGNGVYFAPESVTSFGYAQSGSSWKNSQFGDGVVCLSLCELVNDPCLAGMPNPYYVVPREELIKTKFFFVYAYPISTQPQVYAKDMKVVDNEDEGMESLINEEEKKTTNN